MIIINCQGILPELHKNHDIIKLTVGSLMSCHQQAVAAAAPSGLDEDTLVDGRYTHKKFLCTHLRFLAFVLQEGVLYLPWHRARDIWDCLVANPDACEFDREVSWHVNRNWLYHTHHCRPCKVMWKLFDLMISVLSSRPKGRWVDVGPEVQRFEL